MEVELDVNQLLPVHYVSRNGRSAFDAYHPFLSNFQKLAFDSTVNVHTKHPEWCPKQSMPVFQAVPGALNGLPKSVSSGNLPPSLFPKNN